MTRTTRNTTARKSVAPKSRLHVEQLESRLTPYALSGNSWLQPQLISLSFMPDGTNLGGATSNLFATMDAKWATAVWQKELLRAAQVFAQQTNLNFTVVADDGSPAGSGEYQQGAANFGDIRMGAYNAGTEGPLGSAVYSQPACNYSAGGDYTLNSAQPWKINQTGGYDLFTVAAHEVGHALGLAHSSVSSAVMYATYSGIKSTLRTDDISGIKALYSGGSARSHDSYDAAAANGTFATATDISNTIGGDLTALVSDLDITTVSDLDYYKVTVPAGTSGTMEVKIQSSGLSLLSPLVRVYNGSQVEVASASGLNQYGATLTVTLTGVTAGETYYVKMDGADNTAFGTGKYGLTLNFGTNPTPAVPLVNTQTANGSPLQCGGGVANSKDHDDDHDHDHGAVGAADPVADAGAAQVIRLLVAPETTVAVRVQENLGAERPVDAVDVVFAQEAHQETDVNISRVEVFGVDTLFTDLFA